MSTQYESPRVTRRSVSLYNCVYRVNGIIDWRVSFMNDSSLFRDEPAKYEARPPLGEELLPPVEQPSARFIVQLFVVPALIVVLIVGVWLSFNWLVRST